MLCDICQKKEATSHETHCTSIVGDIPKQRHLCDECFEASNPTQARELAKALQDGCRYCGGEPYGGGGDPLATLSGTRRISFMCKRCAEEYYGFLGPKIPDFGSATLTKEQIAEFAKHDFPAILSEAEEHMKKTVAERDSQ